MTEEQRQTMENIRRNNPEKYAMMQEVEKRVLRRCVGRKVPSKELHAMMKEELEKLLQERKNSQQ